MRSVGTRKEWKGFLVMESLRRQFRFARPMHTCAMGLLLVMLLSGGVLADRRARPIRLPQKLHVDSIEIGQKNRGENRSSSRRIVEREEIDRFVKFINERDSGWVTRVQTNPSSEYSIALMQQEKIVAFFATNRSGKEIWGSITGDRTNLRYRHLSAEDWDALKSILNLDAN
jgi:hypothetical protein